MALGLVSPKNFEDARAPVKCHGGKRTNSDTRDTVFSKTSFDKGQELPTPAQNEVTALPLAEDRLLWPVLVMMKIWLRKDEADSRRGKYI